MANYEGYLVQATVTTTYRTAGQLAAAGRRAMVYEIEFGQNGALATTDCQVQWDVSRTASTAALVGAGGAVAVNLLDQGDVTASTLFYPNLTTESTAITTAGLGLNLKNWSINQRGSYRWRALDDGDNLIIASTASQGLAVRMLTVASGFAGTAVGNISFVER
jgi:hypothetical protein